MGFRQPRLARRYNDRGSDLSGKTVRDPVQTKAGCGRLAPPAAAHRIHLRLVRDYDEAISYFTGQLGFELVEDTDLGNDKRWVLIAPSGSQETRILLAKAVTADQAKHIGGQAVALMACCFARSRALSRTEPLQCLKISMEIAGIYCS